MKTLVNRKSVGGDGNASATAKLAGKQSGKTTNGNSNQPQPKDKAQERTKGTTSMEILVSEANGSNVGLASTVANANARSEGEVKNSNLVWLYRPLICTSLTSYSSIVTQIGNSGGSAALGASAAAAAPNQVVTHQSSHAASALASASGTMVDLRELFMHFETKLDQAVLSLRNKMDFERNEIMGHFKDLEKSEDDRYTKVFKTVEEIKSSVITSSVGAATSSNGALSRTSSGHSHNTPSSAITFSSPDDTNFKKVMHNGDFVVNINLEYFRDRLQALALQWPTLLRSQAKRRRVEGEDDVEDFCLFQLW
jgi:hypothetical protein